MAGFGTPLRAGQVLPHGRLQRMQQGAFVESSTQGLFTTQIVAANPSPNTYDTCRWMRTGRMATVHITSIFPGGFSNGNGAYNYTVPFPYDPEYVDASTTNDQGHKLGDGRIRDDVQSGASIVVMAQFRPDGTAQLSIGGTNATVDHNSPFVYVADDAIAFRMRYPIDPRSVP